MTQHHSREIGNICVWYEKPIFCSCRLNLGFLSGCERRNERRLFSAQRGVETFWKQAFSFPFCSQVVETFLRRVVPWGAADLLRVQLSFPKFCVEPTEDVFIYLKIMACISHAIVKKNNLLNKDIQTHPCAKSAHVSVSIPERAF